MDAIERRLRPIWEAIARLKLGSGGGSSAPASADYLVKTSNPSLSAERVVTDTSTVVWNWATAGQAKAVVPVDFMIGGITGGPLNYTMPKAYIQSTLLVTLGAILLVPGTDFTCSGTTFSLDASWSATITAGGADATLTFRQGWY